MDTSGKRFIIAILAVSAVFFVVAFVALTNRQKQSSGTPVGKTEKEQITETAQLLAIDSNDPTHINNIGYIQYGLERYFSDKRMYPTNLKDLVPLYIGGLPVYSSEQNYLYAYSPKEKPVAYHLGTPLGGHNQKDEAALAGDADFDSKKTGYTNGFDGKDPVYDVREKKQ